jgi:hypothetical protein
MELDTRLRLIPQEMFSREFRDHMTAPQLPEDVTLGLYA